MITLIDKTNIESYNKDLKKFEKLYIEAFLDDDEREDFSVICERVAEGFDGKLLGSFILIDKEDDYVRGGAVYDWYPGCQTLELIYIVVDKTIREKGIGKSLFVGAMPVIQEYLGGNVKNVFFESENPNKTDFSKCPMSPIDRLRIYDKWGAKRIPIDYVQPPLSNTQGAAENLFLFCLPLGNNATILKADLIEFLSEFYKGLDAENSTELDRMKTQIRRHHGQTEKYFDLEDIKESPSFKFPDASICFHYSMTPTGGNVTLAKDSFNIVFNSYECDLMNFRNQTERPIRTHHVKTIENVTMNLSSFYSYSSEGYAFSRLSDRDTILVDLSINYTWSIVAKEYMADIVITPAKGIIDDSGDDSYFTEYDIIKMVKNFGSKQENAQFCQYIKMLDGMPIEDFLKKELSNGFTYSEMRNGVSEIELSSAVYSDGTPVPGESIVNNFSVEDPSVVNDDELEFCKALCGILLGIFDYVRMNAAEVTDTIRSFVLDEGNSFMVFSRGHLCKIKNDNEDERNENIYISPYILIPSAVTAINERTLQKLSDLLAKDDIKQITKARTLLNENYLRDIFNYQSEIDIDAAADVSLGRYSRKEQYMNKIGDLEYRRDARNEDFTMIADVVQGLMLGILAVLQVFNPTDIETWILSIVLIILSVYLILKRKHSD